MATQGQGSKEDETFVVRKAESVEEVRLISGWAAKEAGWRPGAQDYECFFAADPTGFFIGELGGKMISCISVFKYSDSYAFVSHYIVEESYRGRGYGLQTWKKALASLPEGYNLALSAVEDKEPLYERIGFKRAWLEQRFDFTASKAASTFSRIQPPPNVKIQPTSEVRFRDLLTYDTSVFAVPRRTFLEKWISTYSNHAWAATNEKGEVVGYVVVRRTLRAEDGWRIGPLFADDAQIARSLYRAVFEKVASEDPMGTIAIDVPVDDRATPEALQIAVKELTGKPALTCVRMYTKGILPNMPLEKVFGVTVGELG